MDSLIDYYEKLHLFEDNRMLLEFTLKYNNVPMWPLIRNIIMIECIDKKTGVFSKFRSGNLIIRKNEWKEMTVKNPMVSFPKKVVYAGFPNTYMLEHEEGKLYDERIMPYVKTDRNSCMLVSVITKDKFEYEYPNWKSDYFIHYLARKKANKCESDIQKANEFVKFIKDNLPFEINNTIMRQVLNTLIYYSKGLPGYVEAWKLYLKIVKPKLVVICEGCYMGISAIGLTLACEGLKIPTAELQHANESKTSRAHYWGKGVVENYNCKRVFPDYFLTFGKYWNDNVNLPSKKVVVGTHRKYKSNLPISNENVLICLSINCKEYMNIVEHIVSNVGVNTKVYLRLHPIENTNSTRSLFKKFNEDGRFRFANDKNLEYYFNLCKYVMSCGSTVIYEALACGKIVFVPKDQMYDWYNLNTIEDKIYSFQTIQQFEKLWDKRATFPMKVYNDFYEMDYERLYTEFIKKVTKKQKKLKGRKRVYE
jgi:hypothetical protein